MRHNDLRDHTAALMSTVCSDVTTEPQLQPLSGEQLSLLSANSDDNARLDVAATNFGPVIISAHSLTSECLILFPALIMPPLLILSTKSMNAKRGEDMNSVLEKLRMAASPLLFSTPWEVWAQLHRLSTSDSLI